MYIGRELLTSSNLSKHAPGQNRGSNPECLIVCPACQRAAVITQDVVGGKLSALDHYCCLRFRHAWWSSPFVAAARELPDRLAYEPFDVRAVDIAHYDQQHSRGDELSAVVLAQGCRVECLNGSLIPHHRDFIGMSHIGDAIGE